MTMIVSRSTFINTFGYDFNKMNELKNNYEENIITEVNIEDSIESIKNKTILDSIKYCPSINDSVINELNEIFEKTRMKKKKRALLGVIKFIYNGDEYIHCPIRKVKSNGSFVKFGVCKHLDSLLNTKENRKKLSIHKFQFHYLSKRPDCDKVNLYLKTQNSIEDIIVKMKKKMEKK